jgi:hypothetical protein
MLKLMYMGLLLYDFNYGQKLKIGIIRYWQGRMKCGLKSSK